MLRIWVIILPRLPTRPSPQVGTAASPHGRKGTGTRGRWNRPEVSQEASEHPPHTQLFTEAQFQFSSVTQPCPTPCNPTNHRMSGLPVHHQLPEFTQTHVLRVSDTIQPSHPLSSPSALAPNPSQHQSFPMSQLFARGGQSTGVSALASFRPMNTQG